LEIINIKIEDLKPYEKNPRNNEQAVEHVANSIEQFGFKNPIVIDKNNVIVCGHTRLLAAKKLNLKMIPCVKAEDLTAKQIKAFRIADNKTAERSHWNEELLKKELEELQNLDFKLDKLGFLDYELDSIFNLNLENFIDDLKENDFTGLGASSSHFSVTFVFPIEVREKLECYIKENGKEDITDKIIKIVEGL